MHDIRTIRQDGSYCYTYSPFHEPGASVRPGETVCIHTVDAFENKTSLKEVPGIAWLENGKLQTTPRAPLVHNLDSLEWAPYELFDMRHYRMQRLPTNTSTDLSFS